MQNAFACALATGMTQAAAFRQAYPRSQRWRDQTVWRKASLLAANGEVQARVSDLCAAAAAKNEVTVERVVRELAKVAFGDLRSVVEWGPDGVSAVDSNGITDDDAAAVAEVSQAQHGMKIKRYDKVKALELLGKHVGAFKEDNKQRNPLGGFDASSFFDDIFRKPEA